MSVASMVWFKNCRVFELTEPLAVTAKQLSDSLSAFAFTPCEAFESKRLGFVEPAPFIQEGSFVYEYQGRLMIAMQIEDKILPAMVINQSLAEKIEHLEQGGERRLSKREREQLKTEVIDDLLPRAFSKKQYLLGYVDTQLGLIAVNTASAQLAETFTIALRQALGSLKIRLLDCSEVAPLMTEWLVSQASPSGFEVDDMCLIQDGLDTGGTIRCQKQNLFAEDIQALLGPGREVVALRLVWQDQIRFVLKEDGLLQGVKFLDSVLKQSEETGGTAVDQFVTDFAIMSESLSQLLAALAQVLKGKNHVRSKAKAVEAVYG